MNYHETVVLAEARRADLIADAARIRAGRRPGHGSRSGRAWFSRRRAAP